MIGRTAELADALAYLEQGVDVTISGAPGSGRTLFLSALHDHLVDREYTVRRFAGIGSLREVALGALHQVSGDSAGRSVPGVARAIRALSDETAGRRVVVLIDDGDLLDDSSWGAVLAAQSESGFRIVSAQLPVRIEARTDLDVPRRRAYVVHLHPLRLDEMETLLGGRVDGPLDPSCVSRIFAKSAGLPGLAIGMLEIGMQEGAIVRRDGVWTAIGSLWSPALDRLIERQIRIRGRRTRTALELLSLSGPIDLGAASDLVGHKTIEKLEARGLLRFSMFNGMLSATVTPPLVAEYFRHSPLRARSTRLTQRSEPRTLPLVASFSSPGENSTPEPDAVFARVVQEQVSRAIREGERAWRETAEPEALLRYARALCQSDAPPQQISALLGTLPSGDTVVHAQLQALRGRWLVEETGHEKALQYLDEQAEGAGVHAPILRATALRIRLDDPGYHGDPRSDLPVSDDMPAEVQREVRATRALAFLTAGRISDARTELDALPVADAPSTAEGSELTALRALQRLGAGDHEGATRAAYRAFQEARESLDGERIRAAAYVAAYCQILRGDYREVTSLAETALALGYPRVGSRSAVLGLLCMASIVAGRAGSAELAVTRLEQAERLTTSDGPLPTMSTSWPRSQLLMGEGHTDDAIAALREGAERLWQKGARWSAVQAWLIELELQPDAGRFEELRPRLESSDGELVAALRDFVYALSHQDADAIADSAPRLTATGRPGFAMSALQAAAHLHDAQGHTDEADRLRRASAELAASLTPGTYDPTRFRSADILLTRRELELARLAAAGNTNAEIAAKLVLSVRTVESHLHRVMRKAKVTSRAELGAFLASGTPIVRG
ncbi:MULTISPECIES: LuxR C-terminal-related transcriptional regulator [unclassified Microbacterium]|uniref:helix-turn-helix transcriptional regulator n=1 Tax=unclassified Microbacterium TaxID=2609290 RepID=UPI0012FBC89D|nr:LuxR C-terminal-related transcriptional regulator [Microbacterium sp. MAH-37]MVQ41365.1 hypothetical protein [Microbacterium sp. MAH-37]